MSTHNAPLGLNDTAGISTGKDPKAKAGKPAKESAKPGDQETLAENHEDIEKQRQEDEEYERQDEAWRQSDLTRPICDKHNCLMISTSSVRKVTRYRCPVPSCDRREKRVRPQAKCPKDPQKCPDAICEGKENYLEVDPRFRDPAFVEMHCPDCGFHIRQPRPGFNPGPRPLPGEDLSQR